MGLISNFPQNKKLPDLDNPATSNMIMEGYEAINSDRQVVTGSFTLEEEKNIQDTIISQLKSSLGDKVMFKSVEMYGNTLKIR